MFPKSNSIACLTENTKKIHYISVFFIIIFKFCMSYIQFQKSLLHVIRKKRKKREKSETKQTLIEL